MSRFLAINIEGKIGQLTVGRTSSFIKQCKEKNVELFCKISEKKNQTPLRGQDEKSQTPAGKISIDIQLGGASLETRNLSLGCLRFFRLALLPVLDPIYLPDEATDSPSMLTRIIQSLYYALAGRYINLIQR